MSRTTGIPSAFSFLSDAQRAAKLVTADSIFAIGDAPDGGKPLIKTERGIFKDRAHFVGKLFAAVFAAEHRAGFDFADSLRSAVVANDLAIRPFDAARLDGVEIIQSVCQALS